MFIDGVRDSELQQVLRMAWHLNSTDDILQALQFEAAKLVTYVTKSMPSHCNQTDLKSHYHHNGQNKEML